MSREPKSIHVTRVTELAWVLTAADTTQVRLEPNGVLYRDSCEGEDVLVTRSSHSFGNDFRPTYPCRVQAR